MKTILFRILLFSVLSFHLVHAQTDTGDEPSISDEALIVNKFTETILKLTLYGTQLADRDLILLVCDSYAVPVQGALLAVRNPTWNNIREYVIQNLLPEYSRQGSYLETIYDRELMRDIDQYIKYAETALSYGFNMTGADREVRAYLSPEKGVLDEFEMTEGETVEQVTYGGDTAAVYQSKITSLYADILAYEPTGDPIVDDAVIEAMTYTYFENGEEHARALDLIVDMNQAEFTGDEILDAEILSGIFDAFFAEEEADEEIVDGGIVTPADNEGEWDNGLNQLMVDMGMGDRDPRNRYGDAAEPYYSEHVTSVRNSNQEAQVALTNVFKAWEAIQLTEYADKAIEMEQLVTQLYENGADYPIERIEELTGQLKYLWDIIKKESR